MAYVLGIAIFAVFLAAIAVAIKLPPKPRRELVQAEALNRLSNGFEWAYEEPYVTFRLKDGTVVWWEFHHAGRWWEPSG